MRSRPIVALLAALVQLAPIENILLRIAFELNLSRPAARRDPTIGKSVFSNVALGVGLREGDS